MNAQPIPADFVEQRQALRDVKKLASHYHVRRCTISKWIKELGLPDLRKDAKHRAMARANAARTFRFTGMLYPKVQSLRNWSVHDEAVAVLREHMPVYRCDERGRADFTGKFWRVGNVVCDGDELLARADRYRERRA